MANDSLTLELISVHLHVVSLDSLLEFESLLTPESPVSVFESVAITFTGDEVTFSPSVAPKSLALPDKQNVKVKSKD